MNVLQTSKSRPAKVSAANLPQEYELSELVQDIANPHKSWNTEVTACDWEYVTCDEQGNVSELKWNIM